MIQVGKIVNIKVVDHLIITPEGYYSFETHGLMRKLSLNKKYVPGYLEVERIKKEAERIGEERGEKRGLEKGRKETFKEMAKKMKMEGEPLEKISKYTGLSKEEIEKL